MKDIFKWLFSQRTLSEAQAESAFSQLLAEDQSPSVIGGLLGALAARGETIEEIVGAARAIRNKALLISPKRSDLIDVCGTGGDGLNTINVSTAVALVLASAGLGVCKHGNRAVSSQSGSADVLESLGIATNLAPAKASDAIDTLGFAFLFAPHYHAAIKNVAATRQALGARTIFNILGPLLNPAPVQQQLLGVYAAELVPKVAAALLRLGIQRALVVHGAGGLDELSLSGSNRVALVKDGNVQVFELTPEDFGLRKASLSEIKGGDKVHNAEVILALADGKLGAQRDVVVMNAAAALVIAGLASHWQDGARIAESLLDNGEVSKKIAQLKATI